MVIICSGRDYTIRNVDLTDAYADVQVDKACTSFSVQVRNQNKAIWRRSATDNGTPGEWTLNEGQTYSIDGGMGSQDGATITIGQAKCSAAGATDVLELWCWFGA